MPRKPSQGQRELQTRELSWDSTPSCLKSPLLLLTPHPAKATRAPEEAERRPGRLRSPPGGSTCGEPGGARQGAVSWAAGTLLPVPVPPSGSFPPPRAAREARRRRLAIYGHGRKRARHGAGSRRPRGERDVTSRPRRARARRPGNQTVNTGARRRGSAGRGGAGPARHGSLASIPGTGSGRPAAARGTSRRRRAGWCAQERVGTAAAVCPGAALEPQHPPVAGQEVLLGWAALLYSAINAFQDLHVVLQLSFL